MNRRSVLISSGGYLPKRVLDNDELAKLVDTSNEWIVERTGIYHRHIAADNEFTSDLAHKAALNAMENGGVSPEEIDLIILATATPDETFPATATIVQESLGINQGAAFDIQAVCSGFIYALTLADNAIRCHEANTAIVIGAETFSRLIDWNDRSTCVLFGDGAGAVVLRGENNEDSTRGLLAHKIHSDGRHHDLLYTDGGPSKTGDTGHIRMEGKKVFRHAVESLTSVVYEVLDKAGLTIGDIDWLVPHQANIRILRSTAEKLGLPSEKVIFTVDHHANTSAASIPLAFAEASADGRIKPGDIVLMEAMGGGFTWGACVFRV